MNPTTDLRGIITVLNTPFNPDDTLDLPGLARNVENAIQADVWASSCPPWRVKWAH